MMSGVYGTYSSCLNDVVDESRRQTGGKVYTTRTATWYKSGRVEFKSPCTGIKIADQWTAGCGKVNGTVPTLNPGAQGKYSTAHPLDTPFIMGGGGIAASR